MGRLAELAIYIALLERAGALRARGRAQTSRALKQWCRTSLGGAVDDVVYRAVVAATHFDSGGMPRGDLMRAVERYLADRVGRLMINPRPRSLSGLLASVATLSAPSSPSRRGRPTSWSESEEVAWAMRVMGRRFRLYAELNRFDTRSSAAVREYLAKPGNERFIEEVSVTAAIRAFEGEQIAKPKVEAMRKAYGRILKRRGLKVPRAKSGGGLD